jgi:hypothetical protein
MNIINRRLSLTEFREYVKRFNFGTKRPDKIVIHHTWRPTKESWAGERTIQGLKNYYEGKGWPAGPHLFIAEDGIWLFSPMNKNGIHAGTLNPLSIGIEVVGDYDNEKWSGNTKKNTLGAIKALMEELGIGNTDLFFHRDASSKSCPGWAITKEWVIEELSKFRFRPAIPGVSRLHELVTELSAPPGTFQSTVDEPLILTIPEWAEPAVRFIKQHQLFTIRNENDVRDAVKFYRFYQLIQSNNE